MQIKKITILNFDLSGNSLGRAYILAKALSRSFEVKIFGPAKKGDIWKPLRDSDIKIEKIPFNRFPLLLFKLPGILRKIDGDLVYAAKPRFTSFGFGLLKKFFSKTPLILDIDDWEVGFYLKKGFLSRLVKFLHVENPNGFFWTWLLQFFIDRADGKTTVSTFLKDRYGGELIAHAKDTDFLDPERFKGDDSRKRLGLEDKKTVMFLGTPREHKGVEDALQAVLMINDPDLIMVIVGGDPDGDYEKRLKALGGDRLLMIGQIPFKDIPGYLPAADMVVVPQRQTTDTTGQVPSKILDAMSMARPIISTKVSDIPKILNGCGIVVCPESPEEISNAIQWVLSNPEEAARMGENARENCIIYYSLKTIGTCLEKIVREVIEDSK
ncbi:MAG: glycosyltransferase family 4 protein [Thermodesulfovibrionia bacterium]|nr:glycosyltransferase family 4 protein [Thermodesulfovibrionia bacterium]